MDHERFTQRTAARPLQRSPQNTPVWQNNRAAAASTSEMVRPKPVVTQQVTAPRPAHSDKLASVSAPLADQSVVSIKISVPDSETLQRVVKWRPTAKQVIVAIVALFIFTVGYQTGQRAARTQSQQAAFLPHSLIRMDKVS